MAFLFRVWKNIFKSKALIGQIIQCLRYIYIFYYWEELFFFMLYATTQPLPVYSLTRLLVHHWIIVVNYSCQRSWLIEVGQNVCLLMTKPPGERVSFSLWAKCNICIYMRTKKKITICLETLPSFTTAAAVNAQKPTMGPWLTTQFSEVVRHRFWPFHLSNRRM